MDRSLSPVIRFGSVGSLFGGSIIAGSVDEASTLLNSMLAVSTMFSTAYVARIGLLSSLATLPGLAILFASSFFLFFGLEMMGASVVLIAEDR